MPDEIFGLTRDDVDFLRALQRKVGWRRENPASARLPFDTSDDEHQAPEVYIALVPIDGIPAAEPAVGTGGLDYASGDIPGYADCQIYRILNGSLSYIRKSQRVYNLTSSVISQQWVAVKRDKFGNWLPDSGGGTPCEPRNEVWMIAMIGSVVGGTYELTFTINGVEETLTMPADATDAETKSALAVHSELAESDLNVEGGPLPGTSVRVEFVGTQAETKISLTSFGKEGLSTVAGTGTGTVVPGDGLGLIVFEWTPGHPGG